MNEITKVNDTSMVALFGEDYGKVETFAETADYVKLPKIEILKDIAQFKFDDDSIMKEFTGYIIGKTIGRAHWPKTMTERANDDDKKPDCVSVDGKSGSKFSTNCDKCPLNYLNIKDAAAKQTGCKASLNLFVFIDGRGDMPYHLKASATSIKYWTPFALKMAQRYNKVPVCGIKIKFSLKAESKNDMPYATLQYQEMGLIESREIFERNKSLAETFRTTMYRNTEAVASAEEPANLTDENPF